METLEITVKPPTLCLNMIVKNESKIIKRLFDSVISIIDTFCICDTGSTDDTIQIIDEYFKEKSIIGKIIKEPFKNFCYNRNIALQSCIGLSDYVLLLDADMVLDIKNFDKSTLNSTESFAIIQGNDSFYYQNLRIIKNNGLYKYVGVTHEYIDVPPNNTTVLLNKNIIFIRDIGDGGSKHDKFERDIKLLIDGIKDEPNNSRYYFYLANSYYDIGKYSDAVGYYKKRIELGGWIEEVWYSYYRLGLCYKYMNNFSDALKIWLEGFDLYPTRLEAIYEIIKYYRINSKYKLCMMFYNMAKYILNNRTNKENHLFFHNDVYTYKIDLEYTIFSAYLGIKNIDKEVKTILNNCNDNNEINNLLYNMKFYKKILIKKNVYIISDKVNVLLHNEKVEFVSSSNCLIVNHEKDGYLMNIRYVNYYVNDNGSYKNCGKQIISLNKYVEFDKNFNVISQNWINLEYDERLYVGIEDVKIYFDNYNKKLLYIGTGYHLNNQIGIVSGVYDTNKYKFEKNELKQNFKNTSCEKNWVFVDYNNENHIIYDWYPLKICRLENNSLKIVETKKMPKIFSKVRGSTCGFIYNKNDKVIEKEIWFINHIVSYESPRHYYHMISVYDFDMNLLRYSVPFKFDGDAIEYCLSIIVEVDRVLIGYSNWDRTTKIGIYDKKYIDSILYDHF